MSNDQLYESVGNYTKYKLVEMLIKRLSDGKTLNTMNMRRANELWRAYA